MAQGIYLWIYAIKAGAALLLPPCVWHAVLGHTCRRTKNRQGKESATVGIDGNR